MNRKTFRILHLLSQRPDSTGSGIYMQAMLREAALQGHTNFLIAGVQADWPPATEHVSGSRCAFVRFSGGDITSAIVGMSDVMPYPSRRFCDLTAGDLAEYESCFENKLRAVVKKFRPDIIHSHHLWIVSSLARRLFVDLPVVATCHGSDLRQFHNCPHLQGDIRQACQKLDVVMALSRAQKNEIIRTYHVAPERIKVVGAGYSDTLFTPEIKPEPPPVQLVYAGKLSDAKGVPWLLRALAAIDHPPWQLHLVGGGSGPETQKCLEMAQNLGKRVHIHGALKQAELAGVMKQSHLFVLPSFYEGLPLVVLEALASGCRVVATDLPGITELLSRVEADYIDTVRTPRLHAVDTPFREDEKAFEHALKRALEHQMAAALMQPSIDLSPLKKTIASFSWQSVFQRVAAVYVKAVSNFPAMPAVKVVRGSQNDG